MSVDDSKLDFYSGWDIDQLLNDYPKTVDVTIPAGTFPNFYTADIETFSIPLPNSDIYVAEGFFKSTTDSDAAWHQLGEQGWIPSTGGAAISGANVFATLNVTNTKVQLFASNWSSGPGGANRDVALSIRYYVYADKVGY